MTVLLAVEASRLAHLFRAFTRKVPGFIATETDGSGGIPFVRAVTGQVPGFFAVEARHYRFFRAVPGKVTGFFTVKAICSGGLVINKSGRLVSQIFCFAAV